MDGSEHPLTGWLAARSRFARPPRSGGAGRPWDVVVLAPPGRALYSGKLRRIVIRRRQETGLEARSISTLSSGSFGHADLLTTARCLSLADPKLLEIYTRTHLRNYPNPRPARSALTTATA